MPPHIRQALENLFEKEKSAEAQYVLIAIGRQLQVLEPATTNPTALLVKVRSAAFQNSLAGLDASALSAQLQNILRPHGGILPALRLRRRSRNCDSEIDTLKQYVDAEADHWTAPTKTLLAQFRSVVEELAKLPTGRTLILVSSGIHTDPKAEFYAAVSAYLPNYPQFRVDDSTTADPDLHAALQVAAGRNVIIDTIDSRTGAAAALPRTASMDASTGAHLRAAATMLGTTRSAGTRAAPRTNAPASQAPSVLTAPSASMEQLARTTGGVYFHSNARHAEAVPQRSGRWPRILRAVLRAEERRPRRQIPHHHGGDQRQEPDHPREAGLLGGPSNRVWPSPPPSSRAPEP